MSRNAKLDVCSALLLSAIVGCTEPQTPLSGSAGGAVGSFNKGALADYSSYTPAAYEPLKAPEITIPAATGRAAAIDADVPADLQEFVTGLWTATAEGDMARLIDALAPQQKTAFSAERAAAISPTFQKLAMLQRSLTAAFGETGPTAIQAAQASATITPVNATSATLSPHPYTLVLGPTVAPISITLDKSAEGWHVTLPAVPDDAAFEGIVQYHARVQAALDNVTEGVESGKLNQLAVQMALAQAFSGLPTSSDAGAGSP